MMMGDGWMGSGMGWMLFGLILWIFLLAGIVLFVVWLVQRVTGGAERRAEESALEILKKRYAKGEISKAEYEEKKRDIL